MRSHGSDQRKTFDALVDVDNEIVAGGWRPFAGFVGCETVDQGFHQSTVHKNPVAQLHDTIDAEHQFAQHISARFKASSALGTQSRMHAAKILVDVHHFVIAQQFDDASSLRYRLHIQVVEHAQALCPAEMMCLEVSAGVKMYCLIGLITPLAGVACE